MKPLIGITADTNRSPSNSVHNLIDGQKRSYSDAVRLAGGVPVIVPIASNVNDVRDIFYQLDAIMFAGGGDVSPQQYGEETRYAYDIDEARDWHEIALMEMALSARRPILAICRGLQLLNVVRGGTLYQDIENEMPGAIRHTSVSAADSLTHEIIIKKQTALARMLGTKSILANSYHHQAIKNIGDGLQISAWSEDGVIEAVEDMSVGYIVGVQSHPERMAQSIEPRWKRLFSSLVAETSRL